MLPHIRREHQKLREHKSPGPNGLNFKFIKKFWQILKPDVLRFLDEFHANGTFPKGCNASFIELIPKVADLLEQLQTYFINRMYVQDSGEIVG